MGFLNYKPPWRPMLRARCRAYVRRDHHSASGPNRLPAASTAKAVSQPVGLAGPPAASSATPTAQAPAAERPKPTVECSAMVAPRCAGTALRLMPDVSAPESAGMVTP